MFGDSEWLDDRTQTQYSRNPRWRRLMRNRRFVVIELGAGTAVPTVWLDFESAAGRLIRINPSEQKARSGGVSLQMGALEALSKIDSLL